MWIHTNGDIKKVATCKTKPYELLEIDSQSQDKKKKVGMLEDGLSDGEDMLDPEDETRQYAMEMIDVEKIVLEPNILR